MTFLPRLYAIADASFGDPVKIALALFSGGARLIQVRNKEAGTGQLLDQVERIIAHAPRGALVIVNDRVDVAKIAGAGGVHLGQEDIPAEEARRILGPGATIGLSTHNTVQAAQAEHLPVDYIAVGPVFATLTRRNPSPVVGIEGLRAISQTAGKPIVAIGGITLDNASQVFEAGASSAAVIRDILQTTDVAARVREWMQQYNQGGAL
jgi:thiamine-phosphate pyrophosphorylase